ncbi:cupin domain-containing protein [Evansella sp. LMS18]|jgi:quercetin dioxygenase-like cupin family protein|uniref:cupin domain-containing protein n=1 Tax=Evansella sp. LMS18 TaxID=2924033 RepID=UPI0020D054E0|nr:cupin domain-containing protein [Evansella sp. LMS18]UTR10097.1 cupin domain-containing protein [Evansella sp. LMS18]
MKLYRFDKEAGKKVTHYNSGFIISRILKTETHAQISCMHLDSDGIIGFHEAVVPQLLLVVAGEGWVRSDETPEVKVQTGDAVFWEKGEGHETYTDSGLTAIVIESEKLNPSAFMPQKSGSDKR